MCSACRIFKHMRVCKHMSCVRASSQTTVDSTTIIARTNVTHNKCRLTFVLEEPPRSDDCRGCRDFWLLRLWCLLVSPRKTNVTRKKCVLLLKNLASAAPTQLGKPARRCCESEKGFGKEHPGSGLHPVSVTRFPSFPLENLSRYLWNKGLLSNPAPGENLLSGNLVMETGGTEVNVCPPAVCLSTSRSRPPRPWAWAARRPTPIRYC